MLRLEPLRHLNLALTLALPLFLGACPEGGSGPGDEPDAGSPETPEVAGVYQSQSRWDLSSAITEHPGVGTIVADLIVEQVVSLAGVPSPLQATAREKVAAVVHEPIRDYVDSRVPSVLVPDSEFLTELGAIMADVEVGSSIALDIDARDAAQLEGRETILSMQLRRGERSVLVPASALQLDGTSLPIAADFDGSITGSSLAIASHEFALRIDVLLARAAVELLDELDAELLGQQVAAALECAQIVDYVTAGGDSITFEVGGMSFTAGLDDLLDGCDLVRGEVEGYALGLINPALGVAVGGSASAIDADGDAIVERLVSGADYSGLITSVPLPTPTRFNVSFTAGK